MNSKNLNDSATVIQKFYYKYIKNNTYDYNRYDYENRYDDDDNDSYMFTMSNGYGTNYW